jgi:outer membrane protein OmpA-like peptidoglycan-associated protein
MKNTVSFLSILLLLWIAGSSWWYVCKIRKDCGREQKSPETEVSVQPAKVSTESTADAVVDSTALKPASEAIPETSMPQAFTVYFDTGKASCNLSDQMVAIINQYKDYIATHPDRKITITGHGDNTGTMEANARVTSARAGFMQQKMVEAGISGEAIETSHKGSDEPVADNNTSEGRAKNRRTEIQIK